MLGRGERDTVDAFCYPDVAAERYGAEHMAEDQVTEMPDATSPAAWLSLRFESPIVTY